jgi:UDP-glucose 4-epimerase
MRVLITGGSGYIGSRLVEELLNDPRVEEVVVVDIRPPKLQDDRLRFVERSVTDDLSDLTTDRSRPIDTVAHLAWVLKPMRDAVRQREICIGGTRNVLEACARGRVGQVLYMSSATAYGANPEHTRPLREFEALKDRYHFQYSAEKREGEFMLRRFASDYPETLVQIARPCVVGGPNVSNYIFRAIDKPVAPIALGFDPEVQLVHEDEAARALVAILRSDVPGAFNIAGDGTLTLREAYRLLGARVVPVPLGVLRGLAGGAWRLGLTSLVEAPAGFIWFVTYPWLVSNRRMKDELGFAFRHSTCDVLESFKSARSQPWKRRVEEGSGSHCAPAAPPAHAAPGR